MNAAIEKGRKPITIEIGQGVTKTAPDAPWTLVWSDEFDVPGSPDPKKWNYEVGFVRNQESQYYTADRLENARVENSMLIIEGRREEFPNGGYIPGSEDWRTKDPIAQYTSACLTTSGKANWSFGRMEIKAKIPSGGGIWPAIWTLGESIMLPENSAGYIGWPRCGEIDIMEHVGSDPTATHGTLHFGDQAGKHSSIGAKHYPPITPGDEFEIYAVEWDTTKVDFFVASHKFHTVELAPLDETTGFNGFRHSHFLLLNLALGGGWAGPVDDAVLPKQLMIDYVRVYQRSNDVE